MALKHLILMLAMFTYVTANDNCECSDDKIKKEEEEFRKFLLNLPTKVEDEHKYPVIPGEISPFVCSNCIEKDRRKRTIFERPKLVKLGSKMTLHDESRNKCPLGYRRLAFMCVPTV